ncbi:transposase family protein [Streptomyces sp. GESEQ-35]|uniref:transposase family protein n=1 Tax=Streptomyces sp. GESEQ-35 TaxID=2812657 RepID=UPI001B334E72|nr:transposase family protein [Streptomyces sp. GESEQ-35]
MPPSPIGSLVRHCEDAILPSPPTEPVELTALLDLLSTIPDPRRVRGCRYRLGSLLALCLVAVLGGACSLAQIARFAADSAPHLREILGLYKTTPNASTLGRVLSRLDGDAVDDVIGSWLGGYAADPVEEGQHVLVGLAPWTERR